MNYSNTGGNFQNNMNNVNINSNTINKFNKIKRQNYKTMSIHNSGTTNYTKYNHSKDNIKMANNIEEKKKKNSNKKEKKNSIPKMKTEIINTHIIANKEGNIDNLNISHKNNINNNNLNNFKNKKELHPRYNSSQHLKSNDLYDKNSKELNLLRKKFLIGNNSNINSSNKYIPRSNESLNGENNNSSGTKLIKRSNTNINLNEEVYKYKNVIKILRYYIESLHKKIRYYFNKNQIEKNNKIKELSLQNKFLLNENKSLKIKIIQLFYIMNLYMKNWNKLYNENYYKTIKDLITENKFLRSINIFPKNINNDYLSQLKKQIQIEKLKKELLIQNQITNRNENNNNSNNLENKISDKDLNSQFQQSDSSLNNMSNKVSHKRQRTHFNLGKLNEDNNSNRESNCDSLGSYHNISNEQNSARSNTVVNTKDRDNSVSKNMKNNTNNNNNKNDNVFFEKLREMSNYNRALKKMNNNSKKNLFERNNENMNAGDNNSSNNKMINKYVTKVINNIPCNVIKTEQINYQNEKKDNKWKNMKNDMIQRDEVKKNNDLKTNALDENENSINRKQQPIYYRSIREKEKKKIEFKK